MIGALKSMTAPDTPRPYRAAAEPTIAAGLARGLLEFAQAKGASRRTLLERSGIDEAALHDLDARIPLLQWLALMRAGIALSGDPALALHFGELDVAEMSVLGLIGQAAETKKEGFALLGRFWRLCVDVDTGGVDRFELLADGAGTWMVDRRLDPNETPEISESGFAQIACMARRMLPDGEHFRAVHFTHKAPPYRDEFERIFQVPVTFDSDRNAFLLTEGWEAEPIALQPHYSVDIFGAHAEAVLDRLDSASSLAGRVEALIAETLPRTPSAAAVAARLGLGEQTLYRRLKAEGVTFAALADGLRRKLALEFVRDRKLPAKEAAYRLGFSDPTAFSRAFKRWTGSSPSAFRRAQDGDR